jgi:hypothetical protein
MKEWTQWEPTLGFRFLAAERRPRSKMFVVAADRQHLEKVSPSPCMVYNCHAGMLAALETLATSYPTT